MSKLLQSLIQKFEVGAIIRPGQNIFWSGSRLRVHQVLEGHHVWIEQTEGVEGFGISYGSSPKFGRYVGSDRAVSMLANAYTEFRP